MFVDIEDFKSPLAVEIILLPYKRGRLAPDKKSYLPKEPITPDICWEVLKSTNAPRNIENMLSCIAELPPSEQAHFKDVVLSTFTQREQPDKKPYNIVLLGRKLAQASGYEEELAEAQKLKEGAFLSSAPQSSKAFISLKKYFLNVDFSSYDKVFFLSDKKITFGKKVKLPKNLEFPNSSDVSFANIDYNLAAKGVDFSGVQSILFKNGASVDLREAKNLPPRLDVSMCDEVNLSGCDLSEQANLSFKDGAKVELISAKNLPQNLYFSICDEVWLRNCDLSEQANLSFKEGAKVDLVSAKNLPANLDVSMCDEVNLSGCDLRGQANLSFKDGAKVDLVSAKNLPQNLDFSMCDEVNLSGCDLNKFSNLCFKNGAKLILNDIENLPEKLDVSMCDNVQLEDCDFCGVKKIIFKNREQMENSRATLPTSWKGELLFAGERAELNWAMVTKTKGGR